MSGNRVAFLGTGLMGRPMAANILKAGYALTAWNRTISKAQPLKALGAAIANNPVEAIAGADFVVLMLTDGATVENLVFTQDVLQAIPVGSVVLDMSSIKPSQARDHSERLRKRRIDYLDAPVSGGTRGAEAATLAIMAGGEKSVFKRTTPLMETMGTPVHVGPNGAGQLSKLANQAIVAATIGIVAEAMLLAKRGGADPAAVRQALKGGFADSVILQQHGERMTNSNFEPGGRSEVQLKDMNNILEEAAGLGLFLPLTEQMQERYLRLVTQLDGASLDHSAIWLELLDQNKASLANTKDNTPGE